jgi:DNA-binding response OmpR family regulator
MADKQYVQDAKKKRPPLVLLIDPDSEEVRLLKSYFKKENFRCVVAYDGIRGVVHALNDKPDMIITELVVPRLSGYDIIKRLQQVSTRTKNIPIIILTGKTMDAESKKQLTDLEENVVEFVPKPVTRGSFMVKIHRILKTGKGEKRILDSHEKERRNE